MTKADTPESVPLVSIVTATYNALPGLRRTVESVACQTMRDFEHIIIDGGSTDGTREYLEGRGASVRWVSEPDEGIADALNKGVALARGTYVLVLQADDEFMDSESLARAASYLDGETDIVSFDVSFEMPTGSRRYRSRGLNFRTNFKTTIPHQGAFCRRKLFERIGNFDETFRIGMDYEFFLRAYRSCATVRRVPHMLSRMADTGVSSQRDWLSLAGRFAEERRVHLTHCHGAAMLLVYAAYWPVYLLYRRLFK